MAAGMGTRFGKYTEMIPKGFVEFKDKAMVIRSIDTLIDCGIERIIIGTGYHKEKYEALAEEYNRGSSGSSGSRVKVECVFSPRFAETNSMYTLWNCREAIGDDDFLLLESDLVFEHRAIQELIDTEFESAMLITPITKFQDQYYVQMDEEKRLINCGVDRSAFEPSGELVGIHKLSNRFYRTMVAEYEKVIDEKPKLGYEYQLMLTSQKGVNAARRLETLETEDYIMNVLRLEGLQWYEIDDEQDLNWAEEHVGID